MSRTASIFLSPSNKEWRLLSPNGNRASPFQAIFALPLCEHSERAWIESFGASHVHGLPDSVEAEDSSLGTESPLVRGSRRILWVALNAVAAKNATGFLLCSSPLLALMVSSTMWMEGYSAKHLYESSTNDSTFLASTTQRHSTPPVDSLKCAIFPNVALKFEETCDFHTSNIIA